MVFRQWRYYGDGVWVGFWSLEAVGRGWTLSLYFLVLLQSYTKHAAAHPKIIQCKDFEESTQFRGTRVNFVVNQKACRVSHALAKASITVSFFFHKWSSVWVRNVSINWSKHQEGAQDWWQEVIFVKVSWQRKPCGWLLDEDSAISPNTEPTSAAHARLMCSPYEYYEHCKMIRVFSKGWGMHWLQTIKRKKETEGKVQGWGHVH